MPAYLVRNQATSGILGLFVAPNKIDLWWEVDSVGADPCDYEYATLRNGSIAFYGKHEPILQPCDEEKEHRDWRVSIAHIAYRFGLSRLAERLLRSPVESHFWDGADHDENIENIMYDGRWTPFPYADEPGSGIHELVRQRDAKEPFNPKIEVSGAKLDDGVRKALDEIFSPHFAETLIAEAAKSPEHEAWISRQLMAGRKPSEIVADLRGAGTDPAKVIAAIGGDGPAGLAFACLVAFATPFVALGWLLPS